MAEELPPQTRRLFQTLEFPQPVETFTLPSILVEVHTNDGVQQVEVEGLAPFHTIDDIQYAVWNQLNQNTQVYPKYSCLGWEDETGFILATGTFQDPLTGEPIRLENPLQVAQEGLVQGAFVDANGRKKPVSYYPRGRVTIEQVFFNEPTSQTIPTLQLFSLVHLLRTYQTSQQTQIISERTWLGCLYPYFPSLDTSNQSGQLTSKDAQDAQKYQTYIQAKLDQVRILENLLDESGRFRELRTTGVKLLQFQWTNKQSFEGVDVTFFEAPVTERRPYMRLLAPNMTPMTKLFRPDPLSLPKVSDSALLGTWVNEPAPISNESFLFAKVEVRQGETGVPPLYGTLRVMDDGTADFTVQPPKSDRILSMTNDLSRLGSSIQSAIEDIPILRVDELKLGRAAFTVELQLPEKPPKQFIKQVTERIAALSTIFQTIPSPSDTQKKPILSLRYKGVSNFITEDRIATFITYKIARLRGDLEGLAEDVMKEFSLSYEDAITYIRKYTNDTTEFTISDVSEKEFIVLRNPGVDIAVYTEDVTTFGIHVYNIRAISAETIQRITTVLSCVFFLHEDSWAAATDGEIEASVEQAPTIQTITETITQTNLQDEEMAMDGANTQQDSPDILGLNDDMDEQLALEEQGQPAALAVAQPKPVAEPPPTDDTGKIILHQYFVNQLKRLDPALFETKVEKGQLHWSSQCQASDHRQPIAYSQKQYDDMRAIYAIDQAEKRVAFIEYGVDGTKDTAKQANAAKEVFTVMRYGSSEGRANYYICANIFCLRDRLPILEADWDLNLDRDKKTKQEHSCPFCHGTKITNELNPGPGETVYVRMEKKGATKKQTHSYIGFLKTSNHPQGYELPCCFTSNQFAKKSHDEKFARMRATGKKPPTASEQAAEEETIEAVQRSIQTQAALQDRVQSVVNYDAIQYKIKTEYVKGFEKYPLAPGTIGLLNPMVDQYFGQDMTEHIERFTIQMKFKQSAKGMARIGVSNKLIQRPISLFSALAPILGLNTVKQVQKEFMNRISPRIFVSLNFGNLVNEFFDPKQTLPTVQEAEDWASTHLSTYKLGTEFEIQKVMNAYVNFLAYIQDDTKPKVLRHFIHALAEPNVMFSRDFGLNIVVLEYQGIPREKTTKCIVRCPSLGLDAERYANNAVCFLTVDKAGLWEPLLYVDNLRYKEDDMKKQGFYQILPSQMAEKSFPAGIRYRYTEFMTQCRSSYRGAYTFQSGVDSRYLIPLTRMVDLLKPIRPTGFVRDIYNHLVAITVPASQSGKVSREILIPVADDGNVLIDRDLSIHLGLQSIRLASANSVYKFYTSPQAKRLQEVSDAYTLDSFIYAPKAFKQTIIKAVIAFRLGGPSSPVRITLPIEPIKDGDKDIPEDLINRSAVEQGRIFTFEYEINRRLMVQSLSEQVSSLVMKKREIDDIYEHLRLSFSRWIAKTANGASMREFVENLLDDDTLPYFEKMRRMIIYFSSTITKMFEPDEEPYETPDILLRKPCVMIENEDECTDSCRWVEEGSPRCKIHTPKALIFGSGEQDNQEKDAVQYFMLRLLDEILRIPAKRHELFTQTVKRIQIPQTNIQVGDQWVIPENTPTWYEILQASSTDSVFQEAPKYLEEKSRSQETDAERQARLALQNIRPLPSGLESIFLPEFQSQLAVKVIAPDDVSNRSQAILQYYGVRAATSNPNILQDSNLVIIGNKFNLPVLQIILNQTPVAVQGATSIVSSEFVTAVKIIIPDYPEGPAVCVLIRDQSESIPASFLTDRILQEDIKYGKRFRGVKPTQQPVISQPEPEPEPELTKDNNQNMENETPIQPVVRRRLTAKKTNMVNAETIRQAQIEARRLKNEETTREAERMAAERAREEAELTRNMPGLTTVNNLPYSPSQNVD